MNVPGKNIIALALQSPSKFCGFLVCNSG